MSVSESLLPPGTQQIPHREGERSERLPALGAGVRLRHCAPRACGGGGPPGGGGGDPAVDLSPSHPSPSLIDLQRVRVTRALMVRSSKSRRASRHCAAAAPACGGGRERERAGSADDSEKREKGAKGTRTERGRKSSRSKGAWGARASARALLRVRDFIRFRRYASCQVEKVELGRSAASLRVGYALHTRLVMHSLSGGAWSDGAIRDSYSLE